MKIYGFLRKIDFCGTTSRDKINLKNIKQMEAELTRQMEAELNRRVEVELNRQMQFF